MIHIITTIIPPINGGISIALKVILMYLWTIRYRRILYGPSYEKKMHLIVWKAWYFSPATGKNALAH
jgi:hypothetical protein